MRSAAPLALVACAWLLLLAPPAAADGEPAPPAGPRLHCPEKERSFGEVLQGAVVEVEVPVENRGTAPLRIYSVESPCGCTVPYFPREPLAPGAKDVIRLVFDSAEKQGFQSFRIAVHSNDPTQTDRGAFCTLLTLRGEVGTLYRVNPGGAYFGEVLRGGEAQERVITVRGQGAARGAFEARLVGTPPDFIEVASEGDAAAGYRLRIRLLPHVPVGEMLHELVFETGVKEQPRFRVPVMALVSGPIRAPEYARLHPATRAGGELRVRIERPDDLPLVVRELEHDRELLEVSTELLSPQRLDLVVRLRPGAPPGPFATRVVVHTDEPRQPRVAIAVFGDVTPDVRVEPGALLLPAGPVAEAGLVVRATRPVTAVRVEPAGSALTAALETPAVGPQRVVVRGRAEGPAWLVLETGVAGEERVRVPVVVLPGR